MFAFIRIRRVTLNNTAGRHDLVQKVATSSVVALGHVDIRNVALVVSGQAIEAGLSLVISSGGL